MRAIDRRTRTGRALADWRDAIVEDLGGEQAISAQQATLIELASRTKLLLDGVDAWLLSQGRPPVNKKSQRLWPVVRERTARSDSLALYLGQLGLEKVRRVEEEGVQKLAALHGSDRAAPNTVLPLGRSSTEVAQFRHRGSKAGLGGGN